jgi:hypothetical protein
LNSLFIWNDFFLLLAYFNDSWTINYFGLFLRSLFLLDFFAGNSLVFYFFFGLGHSLVFAAIEQAQLDVFPHGIEFLQVLLFIQRELLWGFTLA